MSLENSIKDCISQELEKGIIEKVIAAKLEECIASSIKDMFGWNGEIKKVIEDKIKGVMVPYLEKYDYSAYIVKLDNVLVDVLKNTSIDNKKLLTNFKELMVVNEKTKSIKVSDLFDKWKERVAKEVDTSELEVSYDDGVSYEMVEISLEFEEDSSRSWSSFEHGTLYFECEKDEKMNLEIKINRWTSDSNKKEWSISGKSVQDINSLRHLDDFELFLIKLNQDGTKIELDTTCENDEVTPDKEPEASFS